MNGRIDHPWQHPIFLIGCDALSDGSTRPGFRVSATDVRKMGRFRSVMR